MIGELKPYSEYKDSGVPWLGKVPEHWHVLPNRTLFFETKERNHPDDQLLSVTISKGIIKQSALLSDTSKKDSSNTDKGKYKLVHPGDIAYNKMRAWQGAFGISEYKGIVSPAYIIIRAREQADAQYFHYLFRMPSFAKEAERWSYGITSDQWSLRPEHFKMIYCCCPPIEEQAAIAHFLNYADRRIRRYIRTKQKLIKLLEEQKQVVINEAVTRGLNPHTSLKSSGIEWLGDIPMYWNVCRLRNILTDGPRNGISPPVSESGKSIESFSISAVRNGILDIRPNDIKHVLSNPRSDLGKYRLKAGDVLLVRGNGNISFVGKAGLVKEDMRKRIYPDILMRLRFDSTVDPSYIISLLNCSTSRAQIENAAKTTVGTYKVNNRQVRQLWMALPSYEEQLSILEKTEHLTSNISACSLQANSEIDLLREFRTRLIADVVTGKLDVREAAAKLPAEIENSDLSDLDSAEDDIVSEDDLDLDEPLDDEAA